LSRSLEDAGFVVTSVESAEKALARLRQGLDIDALVTDLSMPGMNGWDLIREVRSLRPSLPSLLLTGHLHHDDDLQANAAYEPFALLRKPVSPAVLARRIAALVEARPAP
jgi:CheY-like chemotaxis protein